MTLTSLLLNIPYSVQEGEVTSPKHLNLDYALNDSYILIMKRKFKQSWSTIPPMNNYLSPQGCYGTVDHILKKCPTMVFILL